MGHSPSRAIRSTVIAMAATDADHGDEWDDLFFDDNFVAQAKVAEPSAMQRARGAERRSRSDALHARLQQAQRTSNRTHRKAVLTRRAKSLCSH